LNTKSIKEHKASVILITVILVLTVSLFIAPVLSISGNQCSSCHGSTYSQNLDVLEGDSHNSIPSSIKVGQTLIVSVAVKNIVTASEFTDLTNVKVSLKSQSGHFSVNTETYTISNLPSGSAVATWQITGTSTGSDQLVIAVQAVNPHQDIVFSDQYSPNPSITVTAATGPTIAPTASPIPSPTAAPTLAPTQTPASTASPTATPTSTHTPSPSATTQATTTSNPTTTTPTATNTPTAAPSASPTQNPTATPIPTTQPDELNSNLLYVHPPLAIAGYVFIFLFTALAFRSSSKIKFTKLLGITAWILTLAGLVTGMFWAQIAWGSYWSWDIKEVFTLTLFLALTAGQITYFEGNQKATRLLLVVSCILVVVTAAASFLAAGVHSFL
jgi:hypothetical protein